MTAIEIADVAVNGTTLRATVDYPRNCRRFFAQRDCFVEYDVDVSDVPAGVLTIPVLSQVCPVAWATGTDVRVPVVDRRFLESLRSVGTVLCEMYPSFMEGGTVLAGEAIDVGEAYDGEEVGMLFTGGADSLATYIRNRAQDPTLINVQGWVIGIDDEARWNHTRERIETYADRFGTEASFVRSDMLTFLDTTMLSAHFTDRHDGGWYSAVGGGMGLLGLCAPLAVAQDIGTLYVAATHWEEFPVPGVVDHWQGPAMPWGSHPDIDNNVAWGNTRAIHDGFELTRQERIAVIAEFLRDCRTDLPVRSCAGSDTAGNCNRCEKCFRTAFGLALEGVDPNRCGFDLDRESFGYAIERFESGAWLDDEHHAWHWNEIRTHVSPDTSFPVDGTDTFVPWLLNADFEAIAGRRRRDRLIRTVARNTPYALYVTLYPIYDAVRRRITLP